MKQPGALAPLRKGGFATKAAAELWERDTAVDMARGTYRDPDAGAVLFGTWVDRWTATREVGKESSGISEKSIVETHLRPAFGKARLDDIGPTAVRTLVSRLTTERAPKTVRNVHAVLYSIFDLALAEGLVTRNPCKGTPLPANRRKKARAFLTEQQVEQIIAETPERFRPFVILLATTGMRWGEAAGLKVRWVDLLNRTLRVEEQHPAGRENPQTPKSEAGVRRIDLPARAVDVLLPLVAGKGPDELVFVGRDGARYHHANINTRVWVPVMERLGLDDPRPSMHDLRHSHAAILIAAGVPLSAIKERLGHESITTTDKLYGFLLPQVKHGVVEALDAVFGDPLTEPAVPEPSHQP